MNILMIPAFIACPYIFGVAGLMMPRTPGASRVPFIMDAAMRRSESLPLVQDPMYTWSILTSESSLIFFTWSGLYPMVATGSSFDTLSVIFFS